MTRRIFIASLWPLALSAASVPGLSVEGKLIQNGDKLPQLELPGHHTIELHGDDPTMGVLKDKRLAGVDFEVIGHYETPARFVVDPIHTRNMFVHKDGKRLMITYWCDVCYIRTYTPGVCWCCQKYTDLDLRESDDQ